MARKKILKDVSKSGYSLYPLYDLTDVQQIDCIANVIKNVMKIESSQQYSPMDKFNYAIESAKKQSDSWKARLTAVNHLPVQSVEAKKSQSPKEELNIPRMEKTKQNIDNVLCHKRQKEVDGLMNLIDKGEWLKGVDAELMKTTMLSMLKDEQADVIWQLLERGSGDRLRVVWQNMIGYFAYNSLLPNSSGAPALNEMFFGNKVGYDNINKGRPSYKDRHMSKGFRQVLPLLDRYFLPFTEKK